MNHDIKQIKIGILDLVSQGYQVDPVVIDLLKELEFNFDINYLFRQVLLKKRNAKDDDFLISSKLVEEVIKEKFTQFKYNKSEKIENVDIENCLEVIFDPTNQISPRDCGDGFHMLFRNRYERLLRIVMQRPDSSQISKIISLNENNKKSSYKIAGLVMEKNLRRGSIELVIDDDTGSISVILTNDMLRRVNLECSLDQMIIADIVFSKSGVAIAKTVYPPDIPERRSNFSNIEVYAVLISDIHIGSKHFLKKEFLKFLNWISGESGDKEIVSKIKYVVMAGDVVDGMGVYPDQENELEILDVVKQYDALAEYVKQIPDHLNIIIIPGDHDATRKALPQPSIPLQYANQLHNIKNVTMLGNPSYIRIHNVNLLVYHGRSLTDVVATTPGLSFYEPNSAMKSLLKIRHLAPMYGSRSPLSPENEDYMVIQNVPDIFHSGHTHTVGAEYYRGTLLVNSGTWQSQTRFQENVGIVPMPGIVPVVNLSNLDIKIKDFRI